MIDKPEMLLWRALFRKLHLGMKKKMRFSREIGKKMFEFIRCQKPISKFMKPMFTPDCSKIVLDITFACNLKCAGCHKSCNLIPTKDMLSLDQIKKFVHESIKQDRKWARILISGGEPTLHPQLFEIIEELLKYKRKHSPNTSVELNTNGFGPKVNLILSKIPSKINIINSNKKNSNVEGHKKFHDAPIDNIAYKFADFSNACYVCTLCGMALTRYGYYPCSIAASIDRIFGFDLGMKKLPQPDYDMRELLLKFCKYCGKFMIFNSIRKTDSNAMSISWRKSIEAYKKKKPSLSLY